MRGSIDCVQLLLDRGAEVDFRNPQTGATALHYACKAGHLDVMKKLVESGANIDSKTHVCHDSDNHIIDLIGTGVGSGVIDLTGNAGGGDFVICDGRFGQGRDDGDSDLLWNSLREFANGQDPSILLGSDIDDGKTINDQSN